VTGGEEMDAFEAELAQRGAELLASPGDGYPEDYRDPPYDGTMSGLAWFRDVVIPARAKAVEQALGATFADLLPEGCRLEYRDVP
jgi:hypothetical protein